MAKAPRLGSGVRVAQVSLGVALIDTGLCEVCTDPRNQEFCE
jgi:hypothetical protein